MVPDNVALIAIFGALFGAGLNSARAYLQNTDPAQKFSIRKLAGSLISSTIPALATINFITLGDTASQGLVALFVLEALAGAGVSTVVNQAHK